MKLYSFKPPSWQFGWSSNQGARYCSATFQSPNRSTRLAGQTNCDATTLVFRVIDFVSQHNVAADENLTRDGHFCDGVSAPMADLFVKLPQLKVAFESCLSSLQQAKAQQ